jgi:hypothetical protein
LKAEPTATIKLSSESKLTRNRLGFAEQTLLLKWIKKQAVAGYADHTDAAAAAAKELGFEIVPSNLRTVCATTPKLLERICVRKPREVGPKTPNTDELVALKKRVAVLEAIVEKMQKDFY